MADMIGLPTFYLRTFGCQMNEHDSERLHGLLAAEGLTRVASPEEAGIIVYNTCSVREKAETRLLGHLGTARRLKAQDAGRLVVVAGCVAQSWGEGLLKEQPHVDVLVGPQSLAELPRLLRDRIVHRTRGAALAESSSVFSADLPRVRRAGPTAWVQIMTGCTNFCSYCVVPFVRGPEISRAASDIIVEVEDLVRDGVREITLLGQNVNAYGREPGFNGTQDFGELLWRLADIPGLARLRFMTSHPKDVSPQLIEALAACPVVCRHLHLPAQSGSDRILKAMRRGYTRSQYVDLVGRLRAASPQLALTTDLIVAFQGETEDDFQDTLSLVRDCAYETAFTFIYSPRPHTAAAALPGCVSHDTARRRMEELIALVQEQSAEMNSRLVGSTQEIMVEGESEDGTVWGRTGTYKMVHAAMGTAAVPPPGTILDVTVQSATSATLKGTVVEAGAAASD
ncbi:MAG: tRNA (N6-isopentenyl adenosine(37)-C2)-methylthiotransferase MiaB [Actinobacteria bacterium]|nr:tRNA (N6-isopentenyl adenosine(37)-C2)-methylthiotransferase MiaB [Actinomycetota bacterium]